ncbi:hypothetical protein FLCH110379_10390 [Flavobacterium chungbukense]
MSLMGNSDDSGKANSQLLYVKGSKIVYRKWIKRSTTNNDELEMKLPSHPFNIISELVLII